MNLIEITAELRRALRTQYIATKEVAERDHDGQIKRLVGRLERPDVKAMVDEGWKALDETWNNVRVDIRATDDVELRAVLYIDVMNQQDNFFAAVEPFLAGTADKVRMADLRAKGRASIASFPITVD